MSKVNKITSLLAALIMLTTMFYLPGTADAAPASLGGVTLNAYTDKTGTTAVDFSTLQAGSKFFVRLGVNAAYVKGLDFAIEYSNNLKVAGISDGFGGSTPDHGIWGQDPLNSTDNYLKVANYDSTNRKINFALTMAKLLNADGVYDFGTRNIYYIQFEVVNTGNSYVKLYVPASQSSVAGSQGIVYMDKDNTLYAVPAAAINNSLASFTIGAAQSVPGAPTNLVQNDFLNTFGWTNVSGFEKIADYEFSTDNGVNWNPCTANPQPIGNGIYPAGTVQVRVKADAANNSSNQHGVSLVSTADYTAGGNDECFIATAAFGSKFTPAVALLREFRDKFLLTNQPGQVFVKIYYHNSPPIASYIAGHDFLKLTVRCLLIPFIVLAFAFMHPPLMVLILTCLVFMLLAWYKKKYQVIHQE